MLTPRDIVFNIFPGVNQPVHLIFALDTSGKDEALSVQNAKDFFKDLSSRFKFPGSGIAHGFLEYEPSDKAAVSFVQFSHPSKVPAYIDFLENTRENSSLDRAMRESIPGILSSLDYDSKLHTGYPKVNFCE